MLVIKRKVGQSITIGDITIILKSSTSIAAQLAINAPRSRQIVRSELIKAETPEGNALVRLEGSSAWTDYGNVSLEEAAKLEAIQTSRNTFGLPEYEWLIEARRENDTQVLTLKVKTSIAAEVINL